MKRILFVTLVLIGTIFSAKAQFVNHVTIPQWYDLLRVQKLFWLNTNDTTTYSAAAYPGAIIFRQQSGDTSHYGSNGIRWVKLGTGATDLTPYMKYADTSAMLSPYLRIVDTAGLLRSIPNLQQVTDAGQETTNAISITGNDNSPSPAKGLQLSYNSGARIEAANPSTGDPTSLTLAASTVYADDAVIGPLTTTGNAKFTGNGTPGPGKLPTGTDGTGNWLWNGSYWDSTTVKNRTAMLYEPLINGKLSLDTVLTSGYRQVSQLEGTTDTTYYFGDSYSVGVGASPSTLRFTTLTTAIIGGVEKNFGINSSTMQAGSPLGANSMQTQYGNVPIKKDKSKIICIEYGLNDVGANAPGYDTASFKSDYMKVLDTLKSRGWSMRNVILLTPAWVPDSAYRKYATLNGGNGVPTRGRHLQYVEAVKELAAKYNTMLDNIYDSIMNNGAASLVAFDSLHPNNAGHAYIAQTISNVLKSEYRSEYNNTLYVDSSKAVINNLQINGTVAIGSIDDPDDHFFVNSNAAAFTQEIAVLSNLFNYSQSNYWGGHIFADNPLKVVKWESVGIGSHRAPPLYFGSTNTSTGMPTQNRRFMLIDTAGAIIFDSIPNASILGTSSTGKLVKKTAGDFSTSLIINGTALQSGSYNLSGAGYLAGGLGVGTTALSTASGFNFININGSTGGAVDLMANGTLVGRYVVTASNVYVGSQIAAPLGLRTNGIERLRIDSTTGYIGVNSTTPKSFLQVSGSVAMPFASISTNTTLNDTHYTIRATASGITITFPSASSCPGRIYCIINYNTGGTITTSAFLSPSAVSTTTVANQSTVVVQSDGTNWYQIK